MKIFIISLLYTFLISQINATPVPPGYIERNITEATTNSTLKKILEEGILLVKPQVINTPFLNLASIQSVATSVIFVPDLSISPNNVDRFVSGIGVLYDVTLVASEQRRFNIIMQLEAPWDLSRVNLVTSSRY